MKRSLQFSLSMIIISSFLFTGCAKSVNNDKLEEKTETLNQFSTIESLLAGNYDGFQSIAVLKEKGDMGIGTFNELDGELIMIDKKVYKVKDSAKVEEVEDSITTPFAAVTFFESDISKELINVHNYESLQQELDRLIEYKDSFYAFRIDGTFNYLKARSVPKQKKPYPILSEVTKNQPTFEYQNVKGSLIGFWCPKYVGGVNVPGYHLHFISDDRSKGGHLLDLSFDKASLKADITNTFKMELSQSTVSTPISDVGKEIEKVEG